MDQKILSFIHLYDNHFAHFPKDKRDWIIFPQDFIPDTKKKYECQIQWTMMGFFTYNKKTYNVARAYPINHGSIIDEIGYKYHHHDEKKERAKTAIEEAFQKAKKGD